MEDSLWQKRANVYGRRRVHADLLAWALRDNAIAAYVNRHLTGDPPHEIAA